MYLQEFLKDISIEDSVKYLRSKLMVEDNLTLDEQIDMYYYLVNTLISKKYKPFDDHVLLGYYVKDFFADEKSPVITVSGFIHEEIEEGKERILELAKLEEKDFSIELYNKLIRINNDNFPSNYCFDFTPWNEVLGWKVDEENIKSIDKNAFTAYVLNELSFNGITEESQESRLGELTERVEEFNEIMELPEEEREKHFVKSEVVFSELGIKDERTPEEKEAEDRQIKRDIFYNLISEAKVLKKYMKW